MYNRLLSFLGIARRAGKLSLGFDAATEAMNKGRSRLLLIADDLSPRTTEAIKKTALSLNVPVIALDEPMESIGKSVGKTVGIVSVDDDGFAKKLKQLYKEIRQEECIL